MTQRSFPWQGTTVGDAGAYSSDTYSHVYEQLLHANRPNAGPIIDSLPGSVRGLRVQATGPASTNVDVVAGAAMVDGTYYESDATVTLAVSANVSGNTRIDTVVLRKDWVTQTIRIALLVGTPAGTPTPPALTQSAGVLWEIPLADLTLASGFSSIAGTSIRSRAEWANAAPTQIVHNIINGTVNALNDGDVVIWNTANTVTTIGTANHPNVAGVVMGRIESGARGCIVTGGVHVANLQGVTHAVGDRIGTGTTAGRASVTPYGNLGRIIQTTSDDRPIVFIDINRKLSDYAVVVDQKATGTQGGTFTNGAWRTRDLNTKLVDAATIVTVASNQITLAAGDYLINIASPGNDCGRHKCRLQDITGGATLLIGSSVTAGQGAAAADERTTCSLCLGTISLAVDTVLEVQHQCQLTKATNGFGQAAGFAVAEIYTIVEITRIR